MNLKLMTTLFLTGLVGITAVAAQPISKDVLVNLTKENVEVIEELKETMTYYEIAEKYDVLEEYQDEVLEAKKARIEQKVEEGKLTEEEASEIISNLKECDGTANPMKLRLNYNQSRKGQ